MLQQVIEQIVDNLPLDSLIILQDQGKGLQELIDFVD